uniref:Uncharacterized protein n=1 Tax=Alexandrium monilatum TaxID=311494 RepID=A0A7S4SS69_9DINO
MRLELGAARAELCSADLSDVNLLDRPAETSRLQADEVDHEREALLAELLAVQTEASRSAAAEAEMARSTADFEAQVRWSETQAQVERRQLEAELEQIRVELAESPGRRSPSSDGSSSVRGPAGLQAEAEEAAPKAAAKEATHRAELSMTVENVDYHALSESPRLLADFRSAVSGAIASEAGHGLEEDHVELTLSAGSVVVQAAIHAPPDVCPHALHAALESSETFHESVVARVTEVEGIHEVCTGDVAVSDVSVLLVLLEQAVASLHAAEAGEAEEREEAAELRLRYAALQHSEAQLAAELVGERQARMEVDEVRQLQAELQEELYAARSSARASETPPKSGCCARMGARTPTRSSARDTETPAKSGCCALM